MSVEELSIEQRVAAGAAWLDANQPGWERRVDLGRLDMASGQPLSEAKKGCIVCQVTQVSYAEGLDDLGVDEDDYELGFMVDLRPRGGALDEKDWGKLEDAWVSLVKERFDSGALSDAVGS